jgi:type III restriction enzyme
VEVVPLEVILDHLIQLEGILEERSAIASANGRQRDIEDVDLFQAACSIRPIIIVQACKDGWDVAWTYATSLPPWGS